MTMQITMKQTRYGESGTLLNAGSSYTVSEAFGAEMVGAGFATDVAGALQSGRDVAVMAQTNPLTGVIELTAAGEVVEVGSSIPTDANGNIIATVLNQVGALATLMDLSGNPGQIMVPNDSTENIVVQFPGGTKTIGSLRVEYATAPGPLNAEANSIPRTFIVPCSFTPKLVFVFVGDPFTTGGNYCVLVGVNLDIGFSKFSGIVSIPAMGVSGLTELPTAVSGSSSAQAAAVYLTDSGLTVTDWASSDATFTTVFEVYFVG